MEASYHKYILNFKRPSGTSRGTLTQKTSWFLKLSSNGKHGLGECSLLSNLSIDKLEDYEDMLKWTCKNINEDLNQILLALEKFPSIQFGLEMAFKSLYAEKEFILYPSKFTDGQAFIPINGLVWMGTKAFMKDQIKSKIKEGFKCIKLKIGAIDFKSEMDLIKTIRKEFNQQDIEIRVDANGAFAIDDALDKLKQLSDLHIHSIEQPIKQGQLQAMAELCEKTPLRIALDEELIGHFSVTDKQYLLQTIQPQYIILKPSLIGGYNGSQAWIDLAEDLNIGWWITSALESNIGLNAIAQWTFDLDVSLPQGLGTGGLFINNFDSPLNVKNGTLRYDKSINWNVTI